MNGRGGIKIRSAALRILGLPVAVILAASACAVDESGGDANGDSSGTATVEALMYEDQIYRLPVAVAETEQFFGERGITVENVSMPSNLTTSQALDATGADIAQLTVATYAQGFQELDDELVFFCGSLSTTGMSLMALPDSGHPSVDSGASLEDVLKSLEGKTVGILTPTGSALHEMFVKDLQNHDVDVDSMTFVNVGASGQITRAALNNNSVDVIQTGAPLTEDLITEAEAEELVYMPDFSDSTFGQVYGAAWVANRDWIQANEDSARAFCEGFGEAVTYIEDSTNRETVIDIYQDDAQYLTREAADLVIQNATDRGVYTTEIPEDAFRNSVDILLDLGVIAPEPLPVYSEQVITDK
ncbi:ABC transporter substrate-binding protein [Rhodococcus sp. SJ-2]